MLLLLLRSKTCCLLSNEVPSLSYIEYDGNFQTIHVIAWSLNGVQPGLSDLREDVKSKLETADGIKKNMIACYPSFCTKKEEEQKE